MAGRVRAPVNIVDPGEILENDAILNEDWRLTTLFMELTTPQDAIVWLARHRLLKNNFRCERCDQPCRLVAYEKGIDKKRWKCSHCKLTKSIRDESFFSKSHLSLQKIMILTYCWANDFQQNIAAHEARVNNTSTIVDWYNFCREECETYLERQHIEIGGIDEDGFPIEVEIVESKYFHRKYHRGEWREGHWVFGGIERRSKRCFLVEVPDRRAVTLEALIQQYILPGSHIFSDGWAAYGNIDAIANGVYMHSVVNHRQAFVDPNNPNIHTNNVENLWMRAKRKLRMQFGTSEVLFTTYLHEFMYKDSFQQRNIFERFLIILRENYL